MFALHINILEYFLYILLTFLGFGCIRCILVYYFGLLDFMIIFLLKYFFRDPIMIGLFANKVAEFFRFSSMVFISSGFAIHIC